MALAHRLRINQIAAVSDNSFYVYALKDPRTSPAKPFYIGKGTGTRAFDHLIRPDGAPKGSKIGEILAAEGL